jgi:AraC family transcriptional regulator
MSSVLINPPASRLGIENAILWGRGRKRYHVGEFPGPLSIKTVARGTAEWRVGKSRFEVDASSYLLLNHGQPYSITIDAPEPVETFCIFFAKGFVEDAWRSVVTPEQALLDDPLREIQLGFYERLRPRDSAVSGILEKTRHAVRAGELEEAGALLYPLAMGLAGLKDDVMREIGRIPASRASTRHELHRRLLLAKQSLDESFTTNHGLDEIARGAYLSPFHFHRAFSAAFRETPHAYRTRRRLEMAARLLGETDQSVLDVCLETGFESPATFSNLFRSRYERAPRAFRDFARSNKNAHVFYSRMLP